MVIEDLLNQVLAPVVERTVERAIDKAMKERGFSTTTSKYPANVNIRQASEITGLAVRTLYQMNSAGMIPAAFKSGGKLLFRRNELIQWVENR